MDYGNKELDPRQACYFKQAYTPRGYLRAYMDYSPNTYYEPLDSLSIYTPQEVLEELIIMYRYYYDVTNNEAVKQIRRDAQDMRILGEK